MVKEGLFRDPHEEPKWKDGRSGEEEKILKLDQLVVKGCCRRTKKTSQTGLAPEGIHP